MIVKQTVYVGPTPVTVHTGAFDEETGAPIAYVFTSYRSSVAAQAARQALGTEDVTWIPASETRRPGFTAYHGPAPERSAEK